jgi:hypothetical protein
MQDFDDTFELIFTLFTPQKADFDFFDNPFIDVKVY